MISVSSIVRSVPPASEIWCTRYYFWAVIVLLYCSSATGGQLSRPGGEVRTMGVAVRKLCPCVPLESTDAGNSYFFVFRRLVLPSQKCPGEVRGLSAAWVWVCNNTITHATTTEKNIKTCIFSLKRGIMWVLFRAGLQRVRSFDHCSLFRNGDMRRGCWGLLYEYCSGIIGQTLVRLH